MPERKHYRITGTTDIGSFDFLASIVPVRGSDREFSIVLTEHLETGGLEAAVYRHVPLETAVMLEIAGSNRDFREAFVRALAEQYRDVPEVARLRAEVVTESRPNTPTLPPPGAS